MFQNHLVNGRFPEDSKATCGKVKFSKDAKGCMAADRRYLTRRVPQYANHAQSYVKKTFGEKTIDATRELERKKLSRGETVRATGRTYQLVNRIQGKNFNMLDDFVDSCQTRKRKASRRDTDAQEDAVDTQEGAANAKRSSKRRART